MGDGCLSQSSTETLHTVTLHIYIEREGRLTHLSIKHRDPAHFYIEYIYIYIYIYLCVYILKGDGHPVN